MYPLDPSGTGVFQAYCDQQSAGGGWTRVARLNGSTSGYCGGAPSPSSDLAINPLLPAGKLRDSLVQAIIATSSVRQIMYYTGASGRSEFLYSAMHDPYDTTQLYDNYCAWTCADGSQDSTTCGSETIGCGFSGRGTGGNQKKLYIGHCDGLHSGGGFCGLDNRCNYSTDIFVR